MARPGDQADAVVGHPEHLVEVARRDVVVVGDEALDGVEHHLAVEPGHALKRVVEVGTRNAEHDEVAGVDHGLDVSVECEAVPVEGEALEVMRVVAGLADVLQRFGLADPPVDGVCGRLLVLREEEGEGRGPAAASDDADSGDGRG